MTSDAAWVALPGLDFTEHLVVDGASLAPMLAANQSRVGIYWLDFADNYSYIGQSVSVGTRLSSHRRRWADVVRVRFAPCETRDLDRLELAAIRHAESLGVSLRNKLLTNRPGGELDTAVTIREGASLALPWDRARRGFTDLETVPESTVIERQRLEQLKARPVWEELAEATAFLLAEAVPAPASSQRALWTVSALPSTNRTKDAARLMTLSAGRLEVLRVIEYRDQPETEWWAYLNLVEEREAPAARICLRLANLGYGIDESVTFHNYRSMADVATIEVEVRDLMGLLEEAAVLDSVYALVVASMRQGSAPLGRSHNQAFANDLLQRASSLQRLDRRC